MSFGKGCMGAGLSSCAPMHFSIQTMEYHVPNLYPQRENSPTIR